MTDDATPAKVRLTDGLGPLPERDARWALAAEVARGRMAGGWVPVDADRVLAMQVRDKCLELLGLPPQIIEAQPAEKASEPAKRLRLAWWR